MSAAEAASPARARLVLVTGLSGSGKSTVAKCFEDLGYYCVDNLPLPLLRQFVAAPLDFVPGRDHIAVVMDMRAPGFAAEAPLLLAELDRNRIQTTLVFLESSEEALIRRFSESRRPHPFSDELPVVECIRAERAMMSELRGAADLILDTSDWSIHDIRSLIYREFGRDAGHEPVMNVSLVSFGYKHGAPFGADLLFDVRFLPNPHFDPDAAATHRPGRAGARVPPPEDGFPGTGHAARRPSALPPAALSAGESQLPHDRHRLHRRPASVGRLRRSARGAARGGQLDGAGEAPRPREVETLTAVLLVTHGRLAQELLAAAETIAGVRPDIRALSLEWNEGIDAARARIAAAVAGLDRGEGVLILTDMYGSTPSNAAIALAVPGRIEVVTGVNLPMVVRMSCSSVLPGTLTETARWLEEKGRRSICRGGTADPKGPPPPPAVGCSDRD